MADYITAIRTSQGDKTFDYNALANLPTEMTPSAHAARHAIDGNDPLWLATSTEAGFMSASDKSKLDGVNLTALNSLQSLTQHTWKRRTYQVGSELNDPQSVNIPQYCSVPSDYAMALTEPNTSNSNMFYVTYYDSIEVTFNGCEAIISLVGENQISYTYNSFDANTVQNAIRGKYLYLRNASSTLHYGSLVYIPDDAVASKSSLIMNSTGYYYTVISPVQTVSTYCNIDDWEIVSSDSKDSYPDTSITSDYQYEYLGIPADNAKIASRMEYGYYIGTGVTGINNPNTLTFGFIPKFVIIISSDSSRYPALFFTYEMDSIGIESYDTGSNNSPGTLYLTWEGNTLSWYTKSTISGEYGNSASHEQRNKNGIKYYFVAIG